MARRDGSAAIWAAIKELCRLYSAHGGKARIVSQVVGMSAALDALHAICMVVKGMDDVPMLVDTVVGATVVGPPDGDGGHAGGSW